MRFARPGNVLPDSLPANILASPYDSSCNVTYLYPVDVRANSDDTVTCQ